MYVKEFLVSNLIKEEITFENSKRINHDFVIFSGTIQISPWGSSGGVQRYYSDFQRTAVKKEKRKWIIPSVLPGLIFLIDQFSWRKVFECECKFWRNIYIYIQVYSNIIVVWNSIKWIDKFQMLPLQKHSNMHFERSILID